MRNAFPRFKVAVLLSTLFGCQFTVPLPPTASSRVEPSKTAASDAAKPFIAHCPPRVDGGEGGQGDVELREYTFLSPLAETLACHTSDAYVRRRVLDAAFRCETRLENLALKIRHERDARSVLTFTGGTMAATSATLSAAVSGESDELRVTTAILAGVGALTVLGSQIVGDPAAEMKLYTAVQREYERAQDYVRALWDAKEENADTFFFGAEAQLNRCASVVDTGSSVGESDRARFVQGATGPGKSADKDHDGGVSDAGAGD